ncbi:MAG: aminotransferase class V-fold PLP-dependent enzyme [Fimbriiglobus sp.]
MIYLDNAATTFPKPEEVYVAMDRFARTSLANPGRAGHKMALASEHALDEGRNRLNKFLNGKSPERMIFTLNGTDSLNMAMKGTLNPGDHVITSDLEHNSVSRPLVSMAEAGLIELTRIAADETGTLRPQDVLAAITPKTRMVAITHASNVLGTIQPIAEIAAGLRQHPRVLFLVDAAQTVGVVPIDLQALGIHLLAFPGHKGLFGPVGIGALYVAPGVEIRPWREGGTGGDSSTPTQPKDFPYYLEGGTPNVLGVVGMTAGLAFVEAKTPDAIRHHEVALCDRLREQLAPAGFLFAGHSDPARRVGTIAFRHEFIDAVELGGILDSEFQIAIRPGLHCAPYVHRSQGSFPDGLVRVSPGPFNTEADIDTIANALLSATQMG